MDNVIGGLDIKTNRNKETDYGLANRRIDSVEVVEVILVKTTQCRQNGVGINGPVFEIWTKGGTFLGAFEGHRICNNHEQAKSPYEV